MKNRWLKANYQIQTPIGIGTIVGMTPDHKRVLVMHTRPPKDRSKSRGSTFAKWWDWSEEEGKITGDTGNGATAVLDSLE